MPFRDELETKHGPGAPESVGFRQFQAEYMVSFPAEDYDCTIDLTILLDKEREFLESSLADAMSTGTLLVTGVAGAGKTHAVCDAAKQRLDANLLSVVCAGESSHQPLIVFIDALNEREPRSVWKSDLAALVEQVRRYPWLRLCLTCRSTYFARGPP